MYQNIQDLRRHGTYLRCIILWSVRSPWQIIHLERGTCSNINYIHLNKLAAECYKWPYFIFEDYRDELLDDGDRAGLDRFEAAFATGRPVPFETMSGCGGTLAPLITSVTFGGPDLRTVYLGSLKGDRLPAFRSPVAGQPMAHWRF